MIYKNFQHGLTWIINSWPRISSISLASSSSYHSLCSCIYNNDCSFSIFLWFSKTFYYHHYCVVVALFVFHTIRKIKYPGNFAVIFFFRETITFLWLCNNFSATTHFSAYFCLFVCTLFTRQWIYDSASHFFTTNGWRAEKQWMMLNNICGWSDYIS